MKKLLVIASAVGLGSLIAAPAMAQEHAAAGEKEFGNPGTINFAAETSADLSYSTIKPPQGDSAKALHIMLQPSVDYFVAEGLSVGALLDFELSSLSPPGGGSSSDTTTIGLGPRVGYNYWLTPGSLSLWPKLGILYKSSSTNHDGGSQNALALDLYVPILIHPVKHFHIGVGPYLDLDLSSKVTPPGGGSSADGPKTTTFGVKLDIAGWL